MRRITDSDGQVAIDLRKEGETLSFKIGGIDGVAFPPNREVEIPDDRLAGVIEKVCGPLGFGMEHLVYGDRQPPDPYVRHPATA